MRKFAWLIAYALAAMVCLSPVGQAQPSDRPLAPSGVTQQQGASLAHWWLLTGDGMPDAIGANVDDTAACPPDFTSQTTDVDIDLFDRQTPCDAPQGFNTGLTELDVNVASAKFRLFGDGVHDQDSREGLNPIGTGSPDGVNFYRARTRLFLASNVRVDTTVGTTKSSPFGLLGFGGDRDNDDSPQFEGSEILPLSRNLAASIEIRTEPGVSRQANTSDASAVWFLSKNLSATLALIGLGPIGRQDNQNGIYISLQGGF